MERPELSHILEAAIFASSTPLSLEQLGNLFSEESRPDNTELREALDAVAAAYQDRPIELQKVASGFRFQVRQTITPLIGALWEERPPRYSRALLETLALIVYRQPITRGEIEEVRGVAVSSNIIRTLQEREWVRVVGHRDVPGRPAMFATTRQFLDYFNLQNLSELPSLNEIRDLEEVAKAFEITLEPEMLDTHSSDELAEGAELPAERSAQELFDELDALEANLPSNFSDLIKKHRDEPELETNETRIEGFADLLKNHQREPASKEV